LIQDTRLARHFAALLIVGGALAGCATSPPEASPAPAAAEPLEQARGFDLDGRIAVHYGDESLSGKFTWSHAPESDQVSLATPLGNQLAQIVRDGAGVTLTNSRRERYSAPDVESLTDAQLGWRLPLTGLTEWVRGRAQGAGAESQRDPAGRLSRLKESGWVIDYSYAGAGRQPQRLVLNYPRAEKPLEIRLVIDTWN